MKKLIYLFKKFLYFNASLLVMFTFLNSCKTSMELTKGLSTEPTPNKIKKSNKKETIISKEQIYYLHKKIKTTYFYIGEKDVCKSGVIDNGSSAWTKNWIKAYGGIDYPNKRKGLIPADFIPKENPFYFALPYNDVTNHGHKSEIDQIDILKKWKKEANLKNSKDFISYCKNKWIKIIYKNKVCYAQWEDVGPFETDDASYVFGTSRPKNKKNGGAGLDISPACFDYLGMKDNDYTDWQFVDFANVPDGPWLEYITISNPRW